MHYRYASCVILLIFIVLERSEERTPPIDGGKRMLCVVGYFVAALVTGAPFSIQVE